LEAFATAIRTLGGWNDGSDRSSDTLVVLHHIRKRSDLLRDFRFEWPLAKIRWSILTCPEENSYPLRQ
jgi:hypothetical protein